MKIRSDQSSKVCDMFFARCYRQPVEISFDGAMAYATSITVVHKQKTKDETYIYIYNLVMSISCLTFHGDFP